MIKDVSLLKEVTSEPPIHSIRIIWHNTTNTLPFFSAECFIAASVIPVTRRFSVIPSIYGRILIGRDFPYPLQNAIGGGGARDIRSIFHKQSPLPGLHQSGIDG